MTWLRAVEQMPFGLIGTVADPDGNDVQVIQWGATPDEGHNASKPRYLMPRGDDQTSLLITSISAAA